VALRGARRQVLGAGARPSAARLRV
jgi:hypothetical protein